MSEQPNEAKSLELHQKASQVISEWMGCWSIVLCHCPGKQPIGENGTLDLQHRLCETFQVDEQTRADLLAALIALERTAFVAVCGAETQEQAALDAACKVARAVIAHVLRPV